MTLKTVSRRSLLSSLPMEFIQFGFMIIALLFVRLFKESAGVTTREYIHKLRLALAMQFLQSTSLPIEEVAERCGFDDPRQFRRLWARQHSSPPSYYRSKY